jgi:hypothetical protein
MTIIWQTTNQEPWVSALIDGAIKFKTRNRRPHIVPGTPVILHASTRLWPEWREFRNSIMESYIEKLDRLKQNLGMALGIGIISQVDITAECYGWDDLEAWDVTWGNCAAKYAWACNPIYRFTQPFKIRGFQAPFVRAKKETVEKMFDLNPEVREFLNE